MGLGPECKSQTIIKLLEENIGISLSNFGFGNGFLRHDLKSENNHRENR